MDVSGGEKLFPGSKLGIKFKSATRHPHILIDASEKLQDLTNLKSFSDEQILDDNSFRKNEFTGEKLNKKSKRIEIEGLTHPDDLILKNKRKKTQRLNSTREPVSVRNANSLLNYVRTNFGAFHKDATANPMNSLGQNNINRGGPLHHSDFSTTEVPSMYDLPIRSHRNAREFGSTGHSSNSVINPQYDFDQLHHKKIIEQLLEENLNPSFSSCEDFKNRNNQLNDVHKSIGIGNPEGTSIGNWFNCHENYQRTQPFSALDIRDSRPATGHITGSQPYKSNILSFSDGFQETCPINPVYSQHQSPVLITEKNNWLPNLEDESYFHGNQRKTDTNFTFVPNTETDQHYRSNEFQRTRTNGSHDFDRAPFSALRDISSSPDLFSTQETYRKMGNQEFFGSNDDWNKQSQFLFNSNQRKDERINLDYFTGDHFKHPATTPSIVKMKHEQKSFQVGSKLLQLTTSEGEIVLHPEQWEAINEFTAI